MTTVFEHEAAVQRAALGMDALRPVVVTHPLSTLTAELNAKLSWQPVSKLDLSLVGQNLLHRRHQEFGAPASPSRRDIERGVYGMVEWRF